MRRSRTLRYVTLLLILLSLVSISCRRTPPPPPPAPAPPPPPPPPAPPTITLTANPATVNRGTAVTLTWTSTNATSVTISPEVGMVQVNGNRQVTPQSSVTYTAEATGAGGNASAVARITVNVPPPPPAPAPPPPPPSLTMDDLFRRDVRPILFDYDQAELRADQMSQLQTNATFLRQNAAARFTIEGHADERGNQEYNIALGDRRANAVRQWLVGQGIAENRLTVVSYGEERPECTDQNEACWQRNRKAAFVLAR